MLDRVVPYAATHGLRPIQRFFPDMLWRVDTSERVAYLTFDDGPTPEMTSDLLDTLAAYNAQATCFLIGHHADAHPHLVRDLHDAGHAIGNHTYTHPDAWTTPQRDVRLQLSNTTMLLEDLIGAPVDVMRPPYGTFTGAMRTWCAERQQRMVMWDVMPGDFLSSATASRVARFVIRTVRPGSVIVLHDNPICQHVTPPALQTILETLTAEGWAFRALV
jgi:peptidoglycan/xylan/chitin deacetylase (PgdA/CDA1 family)